MVDNILQPILCNIYLDKLDSFIKIEIIKKMEKGKSPNLNPEYIKNVVLNKEEKSLPSHIQQKIKKSKRRHVSKLGIKRLIESEEYIRIKYVRYADDILIGVRGSLELAKKIRLLVKNFLLTNLHLKINEEKTKITNTYSNRVQFLGMLIYNRKVSDLPYRNSREMENAKRVANKNKVKRENISKKIKKNTCNNLLKTLDSKEYKLKIKGGYRAKIRVLTNLIESCSNKID